MNNILNYEYWIVYVHKDLIEDDSLNEKEAIKRAEQIKEPVLVWRHYIEDDIDEVIYSNQAYKEWRSEEIKKHYEL